MRVPAVVRRGCFSFASREGSVAGRAARVDVYDYRSGEPVCDGKAVS